MWRFAGKEWNLLMGKQLKTSCFKVNATGAKENGIYLTTTAKKQMTENMLQRYSYWFSKGGSIVMNEY